VPLSLMINAGVAPTFDDLAEFTHHPQRCERRVEHQAQAFPGEVVDQGQDARAPAAGERVHHEVERPAQVLILRDRRCARVPKERLRHHACAESGFSFCAQAFYPLARVIFEGGVGGIWNDPLKK